MKDFFKKCREKLHAFLDRIPRKIQVAVNLLLICILPFFIYIFQGSPAFSLEQKYRRAETANLVGPAEILGVETINSTYGGTLVVADAGDGVILYVEPVSWAERMNTLIYREKVGDVSVCGTPQVYGSITPEGDDLTLIVFDDWPEAVRAELDIELSWENSETNKAFRKQYTLTADRKTPGYFRMDMEYEWSAFPDGMEYAEGMAIHQFATACFGMSYSYTGLEYPATVRLYDKAGSLICQRSLELFPDAIQEETGQ